MAFVIAIATTASAAHIHMPEIETKHHAIDHDNSHDHSESEHPSEHTVCDMCASHTLVDTMEALYTSLYIPLIVHDTNIDRTHVVIIDSIQFFATVRGPPLTVS